MNTLYAVFIHTRYSLEVLTGHCLLGAAFFLPISLDIFSVFLFTGTALWAGKMLFEQKILWKRTPLDVFIGLYVLLAAFSITAAPDKGFSFYNYYNLMGKYILTYYLVINNVNSGEQLKLLVRGFLVSAALVVAYGFYQYFRGIDISAFMWVDASQFPELKTRVFSTLGNPNLLAGFLVTVISLSFGLSLYEKRFNLKICLFALTAAAGFCLLLTYSRGLWLSLLAVLGVYSKFYEKRIFWGIIPLLAMIAVIDEGVSARAASIFNPVDSSAALRLALWESTRAMIMEHPLTGIGWGSYWLVYPQYDFFINDARVIIYHAHNMYLNIAAEIGLPGLTAFLAVFCGHIRIAFHIFSTTRDTRTAGLMLGIVAALAGLGVSGLTDYVLFSAQMSTLFWFLNAVVIVAWHLNQKTTVSIRKGCKNFGGNL